MNNKYIFNTWTLIDPDTENYSMIMKLIGMGVMERSVKIKDEIVTFSKRSNGDIALIIQSLLGRKIEILSKEPKSVLTYDERGTVLKTVMIENTDLLELEIWGNKRNIYTRKWTATPDQLICVYSFKNHTACRIYKPKSN